MTPTRSWIFELEGDAHGVSSTASFSTDRPDTIIVDGYPSAIKWRRSARLRLGKRRREAYRASFAVAGHPAEIEWVTSDERFQPTTGETIALTAVDVVAGLLGSGVGSSSSATGRIGRVNLIVDGQLVGERQGDRVERSNGPSGA